MTWILLGAKRPPSEKPLEFLNDDGTTVLGWCAYQAAAPAEPLCWVWDEGARLPSRYDSRHLLEGARRVYPRAWRRYIPPKVMVPDGPISRREAEVIMHRAVWCDGFRRARAPGSQVKSSWASEWHDERDEWNEAYGRHDIDARFVPENFDLDNEIIAMKWFAELGNGGRKFSRRQTAVLWRALGFSYRAIGDKLGRVSGETARTIYGDAIGDVWAFALRDQGAVRRLPRHYWDRPKADPRR